MRYLPHTSEEIAAMLEVVGVNNLDDLFSTIPRDCRRLEDLNLPEPLTEWELNDHMSTLAGQGTLQAIFEYQTLVCRLLGMEVANASMYDGASALAEALLMAIRITHRTKVAISSLIHPLYRRVVRTYLAPTGYEIIELPYLKTGKTGLSFINGVDDLAAVAVQSPNFLGCVEDLQSIGDNVHADQKTLFITTFTEPLAYGLLKNPGSQGADIVCGEGQSFGIPRSCGGAGGGMFWAK
jgi:glycine dehydrogenase subunit 1